MSPAHIASFVKAAFGRLFAAGLFLTA